MGADLRTRSPLPSGRRAVKKATPWQNKGTATTAAETSPHRRPNALRALRPRQRQTLTEFSGQSEASAISFRPSASGPRLPKSALTSWRPTLATCGRSKRLKRRLSPRCAAAPSKSKPHSRRPLHLKTLWLG